MKVFEPGRVGSCLLKNRIIRSATFEGMADREGRPLPEYGQLYQRLAAGGAGGIITGFVYISPDGKAMQPGQAGLDTREKIACYVPVVEEVHRWGSKIFLQLAHTGRQTREEETGCPVRGVSDKRSLYFGSSPRPLTREEVYRLAERFAESALYAREAGFDGVQLHAAHGYLLHQFILPSVNDRKDEFGLDPVTGIGTRFLELVIEKTRERCGKDFVLLVKVSGSDDYLQSFTARQFASLIRFLDARKVDGIEISYGTMDYALNIFRGAIPFRTVFEYNPVFQRGGWRRDIFRKALAFARIWLRTKAFTPMYNLEYGKIAKALTAVPIICTGGFRRGKELRECLAKGELDFIGLARPLLCEPDLPRRLEKDRDYVSRCSNCNTCAVMCDSRYQTRCYRRSKNEPGGTGNCHLKG